MITYSKQINALNVQKQIGNSSNVVVSVSWDFVAEEDGFKASFPNMLEIPYVENIDFIQYENLTQSIVESWIDQYLSQEKLTELQQMSASSISNQRKIASPKMPWDVEDKQEEPQ